MARVSYGSRATSSSDYHHSYGMYMRKAAPRGPCKSLEELTRALLEDINAGAASSVPECTTSELSLDCSALLPLHRPNIGPYANGGEHDLPPEFNCQWTDASVDVPPGVPAAKRSHPQATVAAIIAPEDSRVRQIVQRAASRGIVAAIEAIDGFKYSFNNAWAAKDEDGQRFSYICQDSMQNKDRHANGFTRTQKHLKGEGERGARKPTFDCKGSISVKCSSSRKCLDVYYRHYAIHPKVAERKSFPRLSLSQPQPRQVNGNMVNGTGAHHPYHAPPGAPLSGMQRHDSAYGVTTMQSTSPTAYYEDIIDGWSLKRKRDSDVSMQYSETGNPLSLFDLLQKSESAGSPPPPSPATPSKTKAVSQSPPVNYDLPSWQQPPSLPGPSPRTTQASPPIPPRTVGPTTSGYSTPYPPPYKAHHVSHPQVLPQQQSYASTTPSDQTPESPGTSKYPRARSGGLFSTLKPMPPDHPFAGVVTFTSQRPRPSCLNCRHSKRKCDAQKPLCGSCQKSGRYDCSYDAAYSYSPPMQPWIGAPAINMLHMSHQQTIPRRDSPDPWFPKR